LPCYGHFLDFALGVVYARRHTEQPVAITDIHSKVEMILAKELPHYNLFVLTGRKFKLENVIERHRKTKVWVLFLFANIGLIYGRCVTQVL